MSFRIYTCLKCGYEYGLNDTDDDDLKKVKECPKCKLGIMKHTATVGTTVR